MSCSKHCPKSEPATIGAGLQKQHHPQGLHRDLCNYAPNSEIETYIKTQSSTENKWKENLGLFELMNEILEAKRKQSNIILTNLGHIPTCGNNPRQILLS